ncbi:MAG: hypothetical protein JWN75_1174 [Candidatus Saccharibacteria bacterium]|nr:hypothetical protein [Candidatus Saccharibacteria bacterium]
MLVKLFIATLAISYNSASTSIAITDYPDRASCERDAAEITSENVVPGLNGNKITIKTTARCREVLVPDEQPQPGLIPIPDPPYNVPGFFQPRPGCERPGMPACYRTLR